MKKKLPLLLFILTLTTVISNSYGQGPTVTATRTGAPPLQFGSSLLDSMEGRCFQTTLKLTPAQTTAVLQAIAARNVRLRALNTQPLSVEQRAAELKPILAGFNGQLQKTLTPAQQQQWTQFCQSQLDSTISRCKSQHKPYSILN